MMNRTASTTFVGTLASRADVHPWVLKIAAMVFLTALTAAAAQVSVPLPFSAVPFTLQPMIVLLSGLVLGSRLALGSQLLYLVIGVIGVPVFAPSPLLPPGALRLIGPTGGYLMAYPIAAWLVGALAERGLGRRYVTSFLSMLAGLIVVYGCGALWLAFFARSLVQTTPLGLHAALISGVYPFVVADVLKLAAAAGISPIFWRLVGTEPR